MRLRVEGIVVSGIGNGRKYVSLPVYTDILGRILGSKPYYGTLNIVLSDLSVDELIKICTPGIVNDIVLGDMTYGGFYYWYSKMLERRNGVSEKVVVIRPFKSKNPRNVVEVISDKCLREYLGLVDGDVITIEFKC
jgi:riboflavin kinase